MTPSSRSSNASGSSRPAKAGIRTGSAPVPTTTASTYLVPTEWKWNSSRDFRQAVTPTSGSTAWLGMDPFRRGAQTIHEKGASLQRPPLPMSTLKIGPAPLPGPDPRVASSGGLRLGLAALDHARPAGGSADLDLPGLHRLRHLTLQIDLEQPVVQAGAADLDVVGELEAVLEGALRDAAVQVLDVLLGLLNLALHRQHVLVRDELEVLLAEAGDGHRDPVGVLAGLHDVVGRVGQVARGLTEGGVEQLVEAVEADRRPEEGGKVKVTHRKSSRERLPMGPSKGPDLPSRAPDRR